MIKEYKLQNISIDKFIEQCDGVITDFADGCLLDNLFVNGRSGYYFCKEIYINSCCSGYTVYFAKYTDIDGVKVLFNMWDTFANADVVETA